jgi:hypothetical protein
MLFSTQTSNKNNFMKHVRSPKHIRGTSCNKKNKLFTDENMSSLIQQKLPLYMKSDVFAIYFISTTVF